ncbi:MAG: helix-turn-helix domain-containing protein [Janthinobacterium lividum]
MPNTIINYSIRDIINYRSLLWSASDDFLYLTEVPIKYEPFFVKPDYYCFGMITEGSLQININSNTYNLCPNSLMIYRPGQVFKVKKIAENTKGTFVLFTKKFLDHLNENIFSIKSNSFLSEGIQTVIVLDNADKEKVLTTFNEIFSLLHHLSRSKWELIARNLTSALIYETDNILDKYIEPTSIGTTKEDELYTRFNRLIVSDFKTDRKLSSYASNLCVTSNYLYLVVKKICGKTPTHLISQQVINEAKYLIGYTLQSFSEIAYQLSFSDPFAFSKYFKKHTGYSPYHYRKHADVLTPAHEN